MAAKKETIVVKPLRVIGRDVEYHIVLAGKEYSRCSNQYFIRVKNPHNGPYPFWRVHHGKNVHAAIDSAIQEYEYAHAEALEMNAETDRRRAMNAAPAILAFSCPDG